MVDLSKLPRDKVHLDIPKAAQTKFKSKTWKKDRVTYRLCDAVLRDKAKQGCIIRDIFCESTSNEWSPKEWYFSIRKRAKSTIFLFRPIKF